MRGDGRDKHDNWLLIKHRDEAARAGRHAEITTLLPNSVNARERRARRTPPSALPKRLQREHESDAATKWLCHPSSLRSSQPWWKLLPPRATGCTR